MQQKYRGTGVALVTPFNENNAIDHTALEKLVNHVVDNDVNYVVALGTTGETPTLSSAEKQEILSSVISHVAGRVPVVCGIGGNNTAEVVQQLAHATLDGVDAILSVAPYYNKPQQEGMYLHFKAIAQSTDKDIILYNVPGRTASNLLPATVLRLASDFKNIVAIKEASGNLLQCMEIMQHKPEGFTVLSGDDNLVVAQIAIGMEGIISVAANCFTKDFTTMINAALENNYADARRLLYKLLPGIDLLFAEGNPAGVKAVLHHMGVCGNQLRLPMLPVTRETSKKIEGFLANL